MSRVNKRMTGHSHFLSLHFAFLCWLELGLFIPSCGKEAGLSRAANFVHRRHPGSQRPACVNTTCDVPLAHRNTPPSTKPDIDNDNDSLYDPHAIPNIWTLTYRHDTDSHPWAFAPI